MAKEPEMIPMTLFRKSGGSATYFWHILRAHIVRTAAMPEYKDIANYCLILHAANHENIPWFKACGSYGNLWYIPVNPNYDQDFSKYYTNTDTLVPIHEIQIARCTDDPKDFMAIKRLKI